MRTPPPLPRGRFYNTTGILQKKETTWFIGVKVEQETSAPLLKKILDPPLTSVLIATPKRPKSANLKTLYCLCHLRVMGLLFFVRQKQGTIVERIENGSNIQSLQ